MIPDLLIIDDAGMSDVTGMLPLHFDVVSRSATKLIIMLGHSRTESGGVVIDLTAVTFLASVGLRILAETHERLGGSRRFAVVATGPVTARPIQLTRLDEFLALYPSVEAALTGLRDAAQ